MATFILYIIFSAFICLGLSDSLLGAVWPAVYTGYAVPLYWNGVIMFIRTASVIITSLLSVRLIKKIGVEKVITFSFILMALSLFGIWVSSAFAFFVLLIIPVGLATGLIDTGLNNYMALHYKAKHMNWLHAFWGVGATIGPIIAAHSINRSNWSLSYGIVGLIQVAFIMILLFSMSGWKKVSGVKAVGETIKDKVVPITEIVKLDGAKLLLFTFFCFSTVNVIAGSWASSFLVIIKGVSEQTAASSVSLYFFGVLSGRIIFGFLSSSITSKNILRTGEAIIVLGTLMLLFGSSELLLFSGLLMIGFGGAPMFPLLIHETPRNFGAEVSQSMIGVQIAFSYAGSALMSPLFGAITGLISIRIMPYFLLLFSAILIIILEKFYRLMAKSAF